MTEKKKSWRVWLFVIGIGLACVAGLATFIRRVNAGIRCNMNLLDLDHAKRAYLERHAPAVMHDISWSQLIEGGYIAERINCPLGFEYDLGRPGSMPRCPSGLRGHAAP